MAPAPRDSFLDLERHRQILEDNVKSLGKSLQHWQTWDAEYEGLKEDIAMAGPTPPRAKLVSICRGYDGKLVTPAEVEGILGVKIVRNAEQVIDVLDRRIEYVSQNIKTLTQQLDAAENKLARASIISTPEVRNEEGLPLAEIIEELDDLGNVLFGRTETQGNTRSQLLELLEKAGVKDLSKAEENHPQEELMTGKMLEPEPVKESIANKGALHTASSTVMKESNPSGGGTNSYTSEQSEDHDKLHKQQDIGAHDLPNILITESPEDAALRRMMLEFGMSEVGAVVAELDLLEGSDLSNDDDEDTSSTEDEEDEHGRSTKRVVDEELRHRMIELEEKLGVRMMQNLGPNPQFRLSTSISRNVTSSSEHNRKVPPSAEPGRIKGVRFAEELDISHTHQPQMSLSSKPLCREIPPKRIYPFKSARAANMTFQTSAITESEGIQSHSITESSVPLDNHVTLNGLNGKTIADQVFEYPALATIPSEPDEFDQALLRQEVVNEYYRSRDRLTQRQGGYPRDVGEESEIISLTEEEGGPKQMSRFKAERLGNF